MYLILLASREGSILPCLSVGLLLCNRYLCSSWQKMVLLLTDNLTVKRGVEIKKGH